MCACLCVCQSPCITCVSECLRPCCTPCGFLLLPCLCCSWERRACGASSYTCSYMDEYGLLIIGGMDLELLLQQQAISWLHLLSGRGGIWEGTVHVILMWNHDIFKSGSGSTYFQHMTLLCLSIIGFRASVVTPGIDTYCLSISGFPHH
eukprot:jgi/Botrbrau1/10178/Bobra.0121s0021.1